MIELDSPTLGALVATLGWTLLHFLWQGALAGVLFGLSLGLASRSAARTRYNVALCFLVLLALCPVATFIWLIPDLSRPAVMAGGTMFTPVAGAVIAAGQSTAADLRSLVGPWLPWTVLIWAVGVVLMTARLLLEWRDVRRLTRLNVEPLTAAWTRKVERLRGSIGVQRAVVVLCSARVQVPMVIGWLKPVILVPFSAFTGLTPWQLELVLMHELAHVRRNDYLVNLLQVVIETLLFYHPVIRWVSRVLRDEREHCCDDLVVRRSGDALSYAHALAELAGAQSLRLQTSVGSDGGKLLVRIKRMVVAPEPRRVSTHWSVGIVLAAFGLGVSGILQPVRDVVAPNSGVEIKPVSIGMSSTAVRTSLPARTSGFTGDSPVIEPVSVSAVSRPVVPLPAEAPLAVEAAATAVAAPVPPPASVPELESATGQAASLPVAHVVDPIVPLAGSLASSTPNELAGAAPRMPEVAPEAAPTAAAGAAPDSRQIVARPIAGAPPEFPLNARLSGIEGWVTFSYTIDVQGQVRDLQIVDARPRHVFEAAIRKAVRGWSFEPIQVDGAPVERRMTQTIHFTFDNAPVTDTCVTSTGTRVCRQIGE